MSENEDKLLLVLGEIKGELKGIRELVHSSGQSTNQRIDDLSRAINSRIEDHQNSTDTRFSEMNDKINRKSTMLGGGSGALAAGVIEVIKRTLT